MNNISVIAGDDGPIVDAIEVERFLGEMGLSPTALSDTYATLDANGKQPVRKGELVVNVKDYGAIGNGVADDTAALNGAASAAAAIGQDVRLYMPVGTYKTTGTVTVKTSMDAVQATISYTGTGTALVIGSTAQVSARMILSLPRVSHAGMTGFDGTSIGVDAINLNACVLSVPFVYRFEKGLVMRGAAAGNAYNTVHVGALWDNHKNLVFTADATGWANSNTFLGGRFAYGPTWGVVDDVDAVHVYMTGGGGAIAGPNNNTFLGCSFEAPNTMYYRVVLDGRYNSFTNCRWEGLSGSIPRVKSLVGTDKNVIDGGYDIIKLVDDVDAGAVPPVLVNAGNVEFHAYAATAKTFTASGASNEQIVDTWTQFGGYKYTQAGGVWTPRAGRWRIEVVLGISCGSASGYRQLTLKKGVSILDVDRKPGFVGLMTLRASITDVFNGTESFGAYFDQTAPTGSDVSLSTTARYCRLSATYLGGS